MTAMGESNDAPALGPLALLGVLVLALLALRRRA
jgi:MYXO-CTERM domain-containing protein